MIKKTREELFITNKNIINLIEKPSNGGIPANEKIVIKNKRLNGNKMPNFFKSLKLRM